MKIGRKISIPWDVMVFLIITSVGLGLAIERIVHPEHRQPSVRNNSAVFNSLSAVGQTGLAANRKQSLPPILDFGCLDSIKGSRQMAISEEAIQVKGKLCETKGREPNWASLVRVENITNGYLGTIFVQDSGSAFTTDYLTLVDGKNIIRVEWRDLRDSKNYKILAEVFQK